MVLKKIGLVKKIINHLNFIVNKVFNVLDQLLLTFWSFILTMLLSRIFSNEDFYIYNLFYIIQSIVLLIINSSVGQLLLIDGKKYSYKSLIKWIVKLCIIIYLILILCIYTGVIDVKINIIDLLIMCYYIVIFSAFELLRRLCYSINEFKLSLLHSIILILLNFLSIFFINRYLLMNIRNLFSCLSIIYTIIFLILLLYLIKRTLNNDLIDLKFKDIYQFNKWLIPGVVFYIITNQMFLLYLNNKGEKNMVIGLRLLESIFGLILVFVAAFENYFISTIKDSGFKKIIKTILPLWSLIIVGVVIISLSINFIMDILFKYDYKFTMELIILILLFYLLSIISRMFVIYLRVNKLNKSIFIGNILNAIIVVALILSNYLFTYKSLFIFKILFITVSLSVYSLPILIKCKKK